MTKNKYDKILVRKKEFLRKKQDGQGGGVGGKDGKSEEREKQKGKVARWRDCHRLNTPTRDPERQGVSPA